MVSDLTGVSGVLVRNNVEAFVVPQNDCAQIGVCLRRVLEDKDLARRLGEHARKRAVAYYSLDSAANQYAHVFRGFEE